MADHNAEQLVRAFHDPDAEARSEHISMESAGMADIRSGDEMADIELKNPRSTFRFANYLHGTRYVYQLYDEGYLKTQTWKRNKLVRDYLVSLRFLARKHKVTRVIARRTIMTAAGFLLGAVIAWIVSVILPYDQLSRSLTILLGCGAAISFMLFLYWSQERTHFVSSTGGCEVLRLTGTIESVRACRGVAAAIDQAVESAQTRNVDDWPVYLRKEMHEHYRLQRAGAISEAACSEATRRILGRFD